MSLIRTTKNVTDFLESKGLKVHVTLLPEIRAFKVQWLSGENFNQIINGHLKGVADKQKDGSYLVTV